MTEYDKIFAALKHPTRRQILLENKGEMSFTDIQNAVGLEDTGLLSYHLKELEALVKQSARGKYSLSEIGEASIGLFRKVERQKELSSLAVQNYFEKLIGKIFFFLIITGIASMALLSADIYLSIQSIFASSNLSERVIVASVASLLGMVFGAVLFVFYDQHYFSKSLRTNTVHSIMFAVFISLLSVCSTLVTSSFELRTIGSESVPWLISILRVLLFLGSVPIITYLVNRVKKKHFSKF